MACRGFWLPTSASWNNSGNACGHNHIANNVTWQDRLQGCGLLGQENIVLLWWDSYGRCGLASSGFASIGAVGAMGKNAHEPWRASSSDVRFEVG
eukprot:811178-Amphidinium_carterae.1